MLKNEQKVPKLCYLGSLPVEATSASMMLLYRLLEGFPTDQLTVVHVTEGDPAPDKVDRQIPGIRYHQLPPSFRRGWYFTRMRHPRLFWTMLEMHSEWQARKAALKIAPFRPEAILTIHELFGWVIAGKLARNLEVPLHVVLHDEWFRNIPMAAPLVGRFESSFGEVYRSAASRLCISPYMEKEYARRWGASGTVLYPSRARASQRYPEPPAGLSRAGEPLRVAYGGNVFHKGYWESLRLVASALESMNGQLLIFGPDKAQVDANGLNRPNVVAHGFVYNMLERIRAEANVLFVPMTFEEREKANMQISFPSKLAEYTAAGLPLLIYGPDYCSAVQWARDHADSAEVVSRPGSAGVNQALIKLSEPGYRHKLASRALELGDRFFSYDAAITTFLSAIRPGKPDRLNDGK